jgi:DNA-binding protein Fis
VKQQLERLTLQMYREGVRYPGAVREFQKTFLATVLRDHNANQVKAAKKLGIHRNTLRRQIQELDLDIRALRVSRRRPVLSERNLLEQKRAR